MQIVATFNPAVTTPNTFIVQQSSASGKMVVWNESNISIQLTFQNGDTTYVPAWTARMFCGNFGGSTITWAQHSTLTSNQPPLSQVVVETFGSNEAIPGTFPATLSRQTNIGNAGTVLTATSSIQNDGNNAGTSIIESTVLGDASSAISLTNDAIFTLGDATHNGSFTSNGPVAINKSLTVKGASVGATTTLDGGPPNVTTDGNGNVTVASLAFTVGKISRISYFVASLTTSSANYAHGLGVLPDMVIGINRGTLSGANPMKYNPATSDGTNAALVATQNGTFDCLALKF